jgi:hypothetical protein
LKTIYSQGHHQHQIWMVGLAPEKHVATATTIA